MPTVADHQGMQVPEALLNRLEAIEGMGPGQRRLVVVFGQPSMQANIGKTYLMGIFKWGLLEP